MKLLLLAASLFILTSSTLAAQTDAEREANDLSDTIRRFNDIIGDVVDGELTPSQIDQFEEMITPVFDVDVQHRSMCHIVSMGSVITGGMLWSMSQPEIATVMTDELESLESDIVPGSLHDWLVQFSINLLPIIGFERVMAAAQHECIQKPFAFALHSELPMNSLEMIAHKRCLETEICPEFDDDGNMIISDGAAFKQRTSFCGTLN